MAAQSEQISFRLRDAVAQKLDRVRGEESRGEYTRQLVVKELEGDSPQAYKETLATVREELERNRATFIERQGALEGRLDEVLEEMEKLREDLATAVVALLVTQGENVSREKAQEWAKDHLLYETPQE